MRKLLLIPTLLIALAAHAQKAPFIPEQAITTGVLASFTIDNLGNYYVVTAGGLLKKLNDKGDSLNVFNDVRRYGGISQIDVTNPLKVLLYYRDFSTIVMLDRFLNQVNTIDLRKTGIFQARAVGLSYDNNIWIYDEQSAKLKKISEEGKVMLETTDLRQVFTVMPSPDKLIDRDGYVYLYDIRNGLYVFDYYGALKNELPIPGIKNLQVIGSTIVGEKEGNFVRYTLGSMQMQEAPLPRSVIAAPLKVINANGVYVYTENSILKYKFN